MAGQKGAGRTLIDVSGGNTIPIVKSERDAAFWSADGPRVSIEAARASEAGRGFAVAASDVKLLAGQTSRTNPVAPIQSNTEDFAVLHVAGNRQESTKCEVLLLGIRAA